MKKRIVTLIVALSLLLLVGCFDVKTVTSISLIHQPKTEYALYEVINYEQFKIKVQFNDGTFKEVSDLTASNFTDFSTSQLGTFVGKINYEGVSINFDYKVVPATSPSGFTSGTGTVGDPYIVGSAEQFLNIESLSVRSAENTEKIYYQLGADIVLDRASLSNPYAVFMAINAEVDGDGKMITTNVNLFKYCEKLVFKNATLILSGDSSLTERGVKNKEINLEVENVTVSANVQPSNDTSTHYGVFGRSFSATSAEPTTILIKDSKISGKIVFTGRAATFLGNTSGTNLTISNSTANFYVSGAVAASGFVTNTPKNLSMVNSTFTGTLVSKSPKLFQDTKTGYSYTINGSSVSYEVFEASCSVIPIEINTTITINIPSSMGEAITFQASENVVKYVITLILETTVITNNAESAVSYQTVVFNNGTTDWLDTGMKKLGAFELYSGGSFHIDENLIESRTHLSKGLYMATINDKQVLLFDGRHELTGDYVEMIRDTGISISIAGYDALGNLVSAGKTSQYKFPPAQVKEYLGIN